MQRGFGGTLFEPVEKRRDRELTLGPTMLVALGLGLFTLCGVCFVFGYAIGLHGSPSPAAGGLTAAATVASAAQGPNSQTKPAASQNGVHPKAAAEAPVTVPPNESKARDEEPDRIVQSVAAAPQRIQSSSVPIRASAPAPAVVHVALPGQQSGSQPAVVDGMGVRPALTQGAAQPNSWMVQIAAVSHSEDADVLVSALRKKGYAVSVHRDALDSLMHVQVGPFATHSDAAAMRQKLLNDGYNAMVQP